MSTIVNVIQGLTTYLWGGTWTDATTDGATAVTVAWGDSWLGKLCDLVIHNPVILVFVILGIVGIAVGFFKRLTR